MLMSSVGRACCCRLWTVFGLADPCLVLVRVWRAALRQKLSEPITNPRAPAGPLFSISAHESNALWTFISMALRLLLRLLRLLLLLLLHNRARLPHKVKSGRQVYMPCTLLACLLGLAACLVPRASLSFPLFVSYRMHLSSSKSLQRNRFVVIVNQLHKPRMNHTLPSMTKVPVP